MIFLMTDKKGVSSSVWVTGSFTLLLNSNLGGVRKVGGGVTTSAGEVEASLAGFLVGWVGVCMTGKVDG